MKQSPFGQTTSREPVNIDRVPGQFKTESEYQYKKQYFRSITKLTGEPLF